MMLAKSLQSAAGNAAGEANYIEDVFSTWLYTGNGSTQTINNGIDLAGEGGLVWGKCRDTAFRHALFDTARGTGNYLSTVLTDGNTALSTGVTAYNSNGFALGSSSLLNNSGSTYASWTFRKQPKFFDVVTYTGTGFTEPNISHNLGSVPGCIIIKRTNSTGDWFVYHRSIGTSGMLVLNSTAASASNNMIGATPTSTTFKPAGDADISGATYVAYLFAHNAGGFGLSGEDNVISCGSFTSSGSVTTIDLGYEPQWVLFKQTNSTGNWTIADNMRGMPASGSLQALSPNLSNAEGAQTWISTTSTGFTFPAVSGFSMIYIAIRRGPMKVPTDGTKVFKPSAGGQPSSIVPTGFPADLAIQKSGTTGGMFFLDRLRGIVRVDSSSTAAETTTGSWNAFLQPTDPMNNVYLSTVAASGTAGYAIRRAPGFFDEVCYTGDGQGYGTYQSIKHGLGVAPELIIVKNRSNAMDWVVYAQPIWTGANDGDVLVLNSTAAKGTVWSNQSFGAGNLPTATDFKVGWTNNPADPVNGSGQTYVAYLFASCPGVQSIQSYVGDGTTGRTINCGFTGGARFVCIKATSTTGSWWTFDSARGIVTNNDPALQLNSTAAEVTSADAVDTAASGFIVNQEATCSLNASGVSYLVWAIA